MLAPYGLAGVLTGSSYRSSTDHVTRKLMDEWRQYYPVDSCSGGGSTAGQQQRGPGPGGGLGDLSDTDDMVEVVIGNVRTRYPSCYVLVCDADSAANAAAFNQLAASEGGVLMTPPSSPPSNPAVLSRSNSHSTVPAHPLHHHPHGQQQQQLLPAVPSATALALVKAGQLVHSWRPEEASRLTEQAWQDSILSPAGLPAAQQQVSSGPDTPASSSIGGGNLWDFVDPTAKSNCICAK